MAKKDNAFEMSTEQEKQYEREARLQYDPNIVRESHQNWNSYSKAQQDFIKEDGNRIYQEIGEYLSAGKTPTDPAVQDLLVQWHEHIRYFYEPTLDLLQGLGQLYSTSPDFMANFEKIHPELPAYLETAITQYVDDLETAELERMLAEENDEDKTRYNRLEK